MCALSQFERRLIASKIYGYIEDLFIHIRHHRLFRKPISTISPFFMKMCTNISKFFYHHIVWNLNRYMPNCFPLISNRHTQTVLKIKFRQQTFEILKPKTINHIIFYNTIVLTDCETAFTQS